MVKKNKLIFIYAKMHHHFYLQHNHASERLNFADWLKPFVQEISKEDLETGHTSRFKAERHLKS